MLPGLLALVLTQASAPTGPVRLASMGFASVRLPKDLAASFEQTMALRLQETGLVRVTTQSDVANIIGVERQKQLLGCADQATNCIAELAGALGVEGILTGEVALVGKVYQLTVRILSARDASVLFQSLRRLRSEEEVLDELDRAALEGARKIYALLRVGGPTQPVKPPLELTKSDGSSPRVGPWVVAGTGAALLVAGAILQGLAASDYGVLRSDQVLTPLQVEQLGKDGSLKQVLGLSFLGAGAVVLGGGLLWLFLGRDAAPSASLWINADGAGLAVGGHF